MRYLQIRRCSSCRLRRCFEVGMKEELVRTDEENERYRQLVDMNRRRRDLLKRQLQQLKRSSIPQVTIYKTNSVFIFTIIFLLSFFLLPFHYRYQI